MEVPDQAAHTEDGKWAQAYEKARRTRLKRVQASASVWLGVLTTLLGLIGSVVLVKGGSLVTGVTDNGWLQLLLIVLIGLVFLLAVLALITGSVATWGGLRDIAPATTTPSAGPGNGSQQTQRENQKTRDKLQKAWQKQVIKLVLRLARIPDDERREALRVFDPSQDVQGKSLVEQYQDNIEMNAARNRIFLHASRSLGVAAAVSIILLAIAAITLGTVAPVPSDVVVVYHGRFTCVPVTDSGRYTGVTQVISVSGC